MLDGGTDSPQQTDSPGVDTCTADCCVATSKIAAHFDVRIAELTADGDDLPEMVDVSAMLLKLMGDVGAAAPSVLELGCGSGALTVELLRRGATSADAIDLSPDMLDVAKRRAAEADVSDRVTFEHGDASVATLAAHDWVVLDRVFCCFPDVDRLLTNALNAASRRLAFSVPNSRGWRGLMNQVMWRSSNLPLHFGGSGCPGFVHSIDRIEARLAAAGFARRDSARLGLWYATVWDRPEPAT